MKLIRLFITLYSADRFTTSCCSVIVSVSEMYRYNISSASRLWHCILVSQQRIPYLEFSPFRKHGARRINAALQTTYYRLNLAFYTMSYIIILQDIPNNIHIFPESSTIHLSVSHMLAKACTQSFR